MKTNKKTNNTISAQLQSVVSRYNKNDIKAQEEMYKLLIEIGTKQYQNKRTQSRISKEDAIHVKSG